MYKNKRISIAIASYNGEKYIAEQLLSMCQQTVKPDEIVISDDGSRDNTIAVIKEISTSSDAKGIDFIILQDNIRHGYCGNFEWAISHTTGDIIFVSDQDDVWYENKIERIMEVFVAHPEAQCVFHEANLIDGDGNKIKGTFNYWTEQNFLRKGITNMISISKSEYLEASVSAPLANGMVLCLSKSLLETALPFPKCDGSHDAWLIFSAVCNDRCWYTPEILGEYRLHGNNVCGNSRYKGRRADRIRKINKRLNIKGIRSVLDPYMLALSMMKRIEEVEYMESSAYSTAKRVHEIGAKQIEAVTSGRIGGGKMLYKLYRTDIRYHNCGKAQFLYQFARILLYSRRERRRALPEIK